MRTLTVFAVLLMSCTLMMAQPVPQGNSPAPKLEEVFSDPVYQVSGLAVSNGHQFFVCYPYWLDTHKYAIVEVLKNGKVVPYPNEQWNSFKKGDQGENKLVCVQAVYVDKSDHLWVVDPAGIGLGEVYQTANKVIRISLRTNKVERVYRFPQNVAGKDSYLNDIRVDDRTGFAYLTNSSNGGLVVLNTSTGESRMVLKGHYSTLSDSTYHFNVDGNYMIRLNGKAAKVHADGIAITHDGSWVYYKPLTDDKLYRIPSKVLRDFKLPEDQIAAAVEDLGHFVTTGGMEFDANDNLYMGDLEHSSIVRLNKHLKMEILVRDPKLLIWPDSYSITSDGYLYISCSQIQNMPWFNKGIDHAVLPYKIFRLKIN